MFLNSLLEVSEKTTDIVMWVSVGACVLLFGIIAVICIKGKKHYDAKHIAFAGICLGVSVALSFAKVSPLMYGGSITFASFVPVLIYTYVYGLADGFLVGIIFGLLNFITGPYILTPATFILDYVLAFASIGLMGFARKFTKKATFNVVLGTLLVYVARFIFHLISGVIYFNENAIWVELPGWALSNAFVYSFIYQCVYIPADCAISLVAMYLLAKFNVLDMLVKIITPAWMKKKAKAGETALVTEGASEELSEVELPAEQAQLPEGVQPVTEIFEEEKQPVSKTDPNE